MDKDKVFMTQEVVDCINLELEYQNQMVGTDRADTKDHGLPGQILTLQTYARRANDAWTNNGGEMQALHEIRKCAAIAVRAMVRFGCVNRIIK